MYRDRIEYLKRAIKRTYKRYTGERQDGSASIKDVADFFNIPIMLLIRLVLEYHQLN